MPIEILRNMEIIKIWNDAPSERQLDEIVSRLEDGQIMIWPTDTLYGIACDALNPKAIERVCRLKGINHDKTNLSIVCPDIARAAEYARFNNDVYRILKQNTPGAFTFLCRTASTLPKAFKGRKTVGIRIPACETSRAIAGVLGKPLLTTSIEFDDDDYATVPSLIAENYEGKVDFMVEGEEGKTIVSTVVDCTDNQITVIREGAGELE